MNGFRFSIRTMLVFISCIALFAGAVLNANRVFFPSAYLIAPCYIALWILPAASIGYDRTNSVHGAINGMLLGVLLCGVFTIAANAVLPDVQ